MEWSTISKEKDVLMSPMRFKVKVLHIFDPFKEDLHESTTMHSFGIDICREDDINHPTQKKNRK